MTLYQSLPSGPTDEQEAARLAVLRSLGLLDTAPEAEFDTLVEVAQRQFGCPITAISLIDSDRQWFKASCGVGVAETARRQSICTWVVQTDETMIVEDAAADAQFGSHPAVLGPPFVRFYAGVPIRAPLNPGSAERVPIGTFCLADDAPRSFGAEDRSFLEKLAGVAEALIVTRAAAVAAADLAADRDWDLHRLSRAHRQLNQAERMANIGSWRLTLHDQKTEWSAQTFAIHGLDVGPTPELHEALSFYPANARADVVAAIEHTISSHEPFDFDADFIDAHGVERRVRSMGEVEIEDEQVVAIIGVFQDISVRYRMEKRLRRLAGTDELTGLANRAAFNMMLDGHFERGAEQSDLVLFLIDLDGFKRVNDTKGHLAGDEVLKLMATRLKLARYADHYVARLGGDEFVVAAQLSTATAIEALGDQLLEDLSHDELSPSGPISVTASIGASRLTSAVLDRSELLHLADVALYEAKKRRRCVVVQTELK